MRNGVQVTIGRREFWANLEWETIPLGADRKERLREIRMTVGNGGLYCQQAIPSHDHVAIGYAAPPTHGGRAAAKPSLAAAVANAEKDPWIGVFCLSAERDLWWMVAVTEGHSIIVGGDVVGTQTEVLAAREAIKGYEKDWQFFEGDADTVQEFLVQGRLTAGRAPPRSGHSSGARRSGRSSRLLRRLAGWWRGTSSRSVRRLRRSPPLCGPRNSPVMRRITSCHWKPPRGPAPCRGVLSPARGRSCASVSAFWPPPRWIGTGGRRYR